MKADLTDKEILALKAVLYLALETPKTRYSETYVVKHKGQQHEIEFGEAISDVAKIILREEKQK